MQVYKNYFRILKSTGRVIVLYLAIFTAIIIVLSLFSQSDNAQSFTQSKLDTVFINHDEDSPLINSLYKDLEKTCNFRESTDDLNELKDAIFFGDISYVIIIPKGFTEDFYNGKNPTLEKMSSGASTITDYVTIAINNYLSTANVFLKADPSISEDNLIKLVENSLDTDIPVTMNTGAEKSEGTSFMAQYFNYFVYILLSILITVMCLVMSSYHNLDIRRRNLVSPITLKKMQGQLFLASLTFTMVLTILLIIIGFIITQTPIFSLHSLLYIINVIFFALCSTGIGFLISQFALSSEAASAVSNIVSLGLSFTCGAFVPQFMLSSSLLNVAKFTPTYWFIRLNDKISNTITITDNLMTEFTKTIGIVLIFTIAFFLIALVISKAGRRREA